MAILSKSNFVELWWNSNTRFLIRVLRTLLPGTLCSSFNVCFFCFVLFCQHEKIDSPCWNHSCSVVTVVCSSEVFTNLLEPHSSFSLIFSSSMTTLPKNFNYKGRLVYVADLQVGAKNLTSAIALKKNEKKLSSCVIKHQLQKYFNCTK